MVHHALFAMTDLIAQQQESTAGLGDKVSLLCVSLGLPCYIFRRLLPSGLGATLFGGGVSFAVGWSAFHSDWQIADPVLRVALAIAAMSPFWLILALISRRTNSDAGAETPDGTRPALVSWALINGTAAAAAIFFTLIQATWPRLVAPGIQFEPLTRDGLPIFAALLAGVMIWRFGVRHPNQPATLLTLAALAVWWSSLLIPSATLADEIDARHRLPLQPGWWTWTFQLQAGFAIILCAAAAIQDVIYRRRRKRAWPDRLDDLLLPYSRWPGYTQVEAIIAGMVLILGVYQLIRAGGREWALPVTSAAFCIVTGAACLYMTYRRWSANTAGLGMSLISLAVVTIACAIASPFSPHDEFSEYADRMPVLFNAILFALLIMAWLWGWLAGVWDQQLHEGIPWTTTGRLIPYAKRTAFLLSAIALLVAYQMTLWPERAPSAGDDDGPYRLVLGTLAILLLGVQSAKTGRRRNSPAVATIAVAFGIAAILFVFLRLPASDMRGWILQNDPLVLAVAAIPVLLIAERLTKTPWRAFSAPLWFLALLFMPFRVLWELRPPMIQQPEPWVPAAALATLAVVYFIAGGREHRRALLLLGAVLLIAAGGDAYRTYRQQYRVTGVHHPGSPAVAPAQSCDIKTTPVRDGGRA